MRIIFIILLILSALESDEDYTLGKGIKLGSLPFYIGGYFSLDYKQLDDIKQYRIDDIAILGYGAYQKTSYLIELEFNDFYSRTYTGGNSYSQKNDKLHIERLYFDYNLDENYMFRLGKYNSPIGFWNLLPINVLRETTSNPISSTTIFPKFTTGLSVNYSSYNTSTLKMNLILQDNKDFDADYNNYKIDKHYAIGSSYERDNYTLKFNAGYFHKTDTPSMYDEFYYVLLSARYETDKYQFLTEFGEQQSKEKIRTNRAGYIQGLYRFTEKHIAILRAESFDNKRSSLRDDFAVLGYTYRPLYPIAIKSEFQLHSKNNLNQVLVSLSVLF